MGAESLRVMVIAAVGLVVLLLAAGLNLAFASPGPRATIDPADKKATSANSNAGHQSGALSWQIRVAAKGYDSVEVRSLVPYHIVTVYHDGQARLENEITWTASGRTLYHWHHTRVAAEQALFSHEDANRAEESGKLGTVDPGKEIHVDNTELGSAINIVLQWNWQLVVENPGDIRFDLEAGPPESAIVSGIASRACASIVCAGATFAILGATLVVVLSLGYAAARKNRTNLRIMRERP